MKTKYPVTVIVLGVVSNEGDIMTPHLFKHGLRVNVNAYLDVLQNVVVKNLSKLLQMDFDFLNDSPYLLY